MCQLATARLPCTSTSVRSARAFVTTQLSEWGVTASDVAHGRLADTLLVTSELVTNAVKFCTDDVELRLVAHRQYIEIAVSDNNPKLAHVEHPGPLMPGGRGLRLVDAVAERWGQQGRSGGKTVWAHLFLPAGSALARGCVLAG
jgi:anti-sigma regulatory factor (Ser/Thr protein kinase)